MTFLYILGYIMAWPFQLLFFKKRVYYEDKKHTSRWIKGPAIVVSNHKNLMDFMMSIFLFHFHKLYCLMSELIFSHGKFISTLTKIMGGIRVDRNSYDFSFISKSVDLMEKKKLLIVYPEARIPTTKRMLPFHPSYILIALKSGAPIVPIYTDGTYGIFKRTRVVIGKKIYLSDYCESEAPSKEEIEKLNKLVRNKIIDLEKICKKKANKDKYPLGLHIKYFIRDLGRYFAYHFNVAFRVKVHNVGKKKKNLKIKGGGIIVANHQSFMDPLVLFCAFWRRRVYILAAEVVFDGHPIRSKLLKLLGVIRIDRYNNDFDAFSKCLDILNAGHLLIMFPGGRIETDDTNNSMYKGGASLLAHQTGVPIYPVYLKKKEKTSSRCHVYLGEKIDINSITNGNAFNAKDLDKISDELKNRMEKLEGEVNNVRV